MECIIFKKFIKNIFRRVKFFYLKMSQHLKKKNARLLVLKRATAETNCNFLEKKKKKKNPLYLFLPSFSQSCGMHKKKKIQLY